MRKQTAPNTRVTLTTVLLFLVHLVPFTFLSTFWLLDVGIIFIWQQTLVLQQNLLSPNLSVHIQQAV